VVLGDLDDGADLFCRTGKTNDIGKSGLVVRLAVAVVLANNLRIRGSIAHGRAELSERYRDFFSGVGSLSRDAFAGLL